MAKNVKWSDDYWLLLMQIYLQKPVGVKPMFNRKMVVILSDRIEVTRPAFTSAR